MLGSPALSQSENLSRIELVQSGFRASRCQFVSKKASGPGEHSTRSSYTFIKSVQLKGNCTRASANSFYFFLLFFCLQEPYTVMDYRAWDSLRVYLFCQFARIGGANCTLERLAISPREDCCTELDMNQLCLLDFMSGLFLSIAMPRRGSFYRVEPDERQAATPG